jgi:amino acid adenylation domain-containing protein
MQAKSDVSTVQQRITNLSPAKQRLLELRLNRKAETPANKQAIPRRERAEAYPVSFGQQRMWLIQQLEPDASIYNMPKILKLNGPLNLAALQQALNEVVARHEVLRTTINPVNEEPAQRIAEPRWLELPLIDLTRAPGSTLPPLQHSEIEALLTEEIERPFDLSRDLMIRARLFRLSAQEHILLLVTHHIAGDNWSTGLLFQELKHLYEAFAEGRPSPLPELPIQYADFALWQRQWLQGETLQQQLGYWQEQLKGTLPSLNLPTDRPRPKFPTYQAARQPFVISPILSKALKELSRREQVTLFMVLLAAFKTLLYRYTGQEDIIVGIPIAGRTRLETEKLIGFFVNTLVLRTHLGGNPTFSELLKRVREIALGAYAHQEAPFEKLVELLQPERDLSRSPIFQVAFDFVNNSEPAPQFANLTSSRLEVNKRKSFFDLTLYMSETAGELQGSFEYNTDLFEAGTMARMAAHFQILLDGLVSGGPDQHLSQAPLLTPAETDQILFTWNQTQTDFPGQTCFHHLFELQAQQTPAAVALAFNGQYLTYQALNNRANQLAHHLRRLGLKPDTPVGLCLERSIEMVVALLGVLKAGGAYLPLDPIYPPDRLAFMIRDSQAPILLTQRHLADRLGLPNPVSSPPLPSNAEVRMMNDEQKSSDSSFITLRGHSSFPPERGPGGEGLPTLLYLDTEEEIIAQENQENPTLEVTSDHLAYVIYTSGSTGQPKGVMIPHHGLVNYLRWAGPAYQVAAGQGAPVHSSLSFDLTITSLLLPLLAGRTVTLLPEDHGGEALSQTLQDHKNFSLVKITPAHLQLLNQQLPPAEATEATRSLVIGGEALLGQDLRFWQMHAPQTRLINEYGPTETVVGCCVYELSPGEIISEATPIGRPIANTQLYLLDQYLHPVPVGVVGELYIGGAGVARGYLKRPALTAERFIPDPFSGQPGRRLYKTGDLARYRPDGVLEFLGRRDHQVKLRGFRIELGEIEAVLRQHPHVREAVVLLREDTPGHPRLVAYIKINAEVRMMNGEQKSSDSSFITLRGHSSFPVAQTLESDRSPTAPSVAELRRFLKSRLPDYMVPAAFVNLEVLPLTPNGKLDRSALPKPDQTSPLQPLTFTPPHTPTEEKLATLWSQLLGLERVDIHHNFFDLGGHSLLATQLISRLQNAFEIALPLRRLFETPTIAELAQAIDELKNKPVEVHTPPTIKPTSRTAYRLQRS